MESSREVVAWMARQRVWILFALEIRGDVLGSVLVVGRFGNAARIQGVEG